MSKRQHLECKLNKTLLDGYSTTSGYSLCGNCYATKDGTFHFFPTTPWLLNEFHISPVGGYQGALETYEWLAWKVRKISLISKFVLFVINLLIQKFCSCLSLGLNLELSTKAFRWILSFGLFFISFFIVYFHCWVMLFCFFFKIYQIDQGSRLDNRNI